MPTKIYNAFALDMPVQDTIPFLKGCRSAMKSYIEQRTQKAQCLKLIGLVERHIRENDDCGVCGGGKDTDWAPAEAGDNAYPLIDKALLETAYDKDLCFWAQLLVRNNARLSEITDRTFAVDNDSWFELSVSIFPVSDTMTVGIAFGSQEVIDRFLSIPGIRDYSYWNNTDPPKNVTDVEWEERKTIWNRVMPSGVPSKDGFQFHIFTEASFHVSRITEKNFNQYLADNRDKHVIRCASMSLIYRYFDAMENSGKELSLAVGKALRMAKDAERQNAQEFLDARLKMDEVFPHNFDELCALVKQTVSV